MNKQQYREYLQSDHWQNIRERKLAAVWHRCEKCNLPDHKGQLEVHHLTYARVGCEELSDLQVLCSVCHDKAHGVEQVKSPDHNGFTYAWDTIPYHKAILEQRKKRR